MTNAHRSGESALLVKWVALFVLVWLCLPSAGMAATVNQTGYWDFDEGAGTVARDSAGGHTATLTGGAAWGLGATGYALRFTAPGGYADAGAAVIDTVRSFSVSARVKLDGLTGNQTIVSQDGAQTSAFYLQYREDNGRRFAFVRFPVDTPSIAASYPFSTTVVEAGRWYMVTGVYDAGAGTLALYVDNRLEALAAAPTAWRAGGHLVIGRALYGQFVDSVVGSIDDVRTFDGALSPAQVAQLFSTGSFRVIVDDDGDSTAIPADCDDRDASIHPGAADIPGDGVDQDCSGADAVPDRDGDGVPAGADCDDGTAAIRPGAGEIAGNGVDENCDGVAALAVVGATIRNAWTATSSATRVDTLLVRNTPAGATVEVRCKGRGCPFKLRTVRAAKGGDVNLRSPLRKSKLRVGAVLEIRVLAPFSVAKVARFTMRRRHAPKTTYLCLAPGAKAPAKC